MRNEFGGGPSAGYEFWECGAPWHAARSDLLGRSPCCYCQEAPAMLGRALCRPCWRMLRRLEREERTKWEAEDGNE